MNYFVNFINSGDHFSYVLSSYLIVFFIIFLIFILSNSKTKKLEKEFVNLIKNEENIQRELILNSGKPSNIVDKILEGKMKKFYSEVTLLNQTFILDQEKSIKEVIKDFSKFEFEPISFELISL